MPRLSRLLHRLLSWSLIAALVLQPVLAQAQSIVVQGSDTGVRPRVDTSLSGHPVLNISRPNGAGVSHDVYTEFRTGDAIVNNSATNVNTQLGGFIEGNPNLSFGSEAKTWIGEVVGGSQTQLTGILEVAGPSLDMVLANEFGITCDGCGFYNTNRTTLTTGIPVFNADGSLKGFNVKRGLVTVGAGGLNPQDRLALGDTSRVDVIARAAQLYGQMRAKEANIIAGANVVDYNWSYDPSTGLASGITPQAGTGAVPALAVDVSALGGMYAGAIKLIATEAGVGVRINGEMASSSSIALSSNGRLSLGAPSAGRTPTVKAKRQVRVRAAGPIVLEGTMTSEQGDLVEVISWGSDLSVTGEVSGGAVTLQSAGLATINAAVTTQNTLRIQSQNDAVVIGAVADLLAGSLDVDAATDITLSGIAATSGAADLNTGGALKIEPAGKLGAHSAKLTAGLVDIDGLASVSTSLEITAGAQGVDISGQALANAFSLTSAGGADISGAVVGVTTLDVIATGAISTTAAAQLFGSDVDLQGRELSLAGLVTAQDALTLTAGVDGLVSAAEIKAAALTLSSAQDAQLGGVVEVAGAANLTATGTLSTDAGAGFYANAITANAQSANFAGEMIADAAATITTTGAATVSGVVLGTATSVSAGSDLTVFGLLAGLQSLSIRAAGTAQIGPTGTVFGPVLSIEADRFTNSGRVEGENVSVVAGATGLASTGIINGTVTQLSSQGNMSLAGQVTGSNTLQIEAADSFASTGSAQLFGTDLSLRARSVSLAGVVTAQNDMTIEASTGALVSSAALSGQNLSLLSSGAISITGLVEAQDFAKLTAGDVLTVATGAGIGAARIDATAGEIMNVGVLLADADLQLTALSGAVRNSGQLMAGAGLDILAPLGFENTGLVRAASFDLSSPVALDFVAGSQIIANDLDITAPELSNAGLLVGQSDLDITTLSGRLANSGTIWGADVTLTSAALLENTGVLESSGSLEARASDALTSGVGSQILGSTIALFGKGVSLAGMLTAQSDLTLTAGTDGLVSSADIKAASLTLISAQNAQVGGVSEVAGAANLTAAGTLSTDAGTGFYANAITANAQAANFAGEMIADSVTEITTTGAASVSGILLGQSTTLIAGTDATVSGFLAGQNALTLTASGDVEVTASGILFGADLDVNAATFESTGAVLGTWIDLNTTSGDLNQNGTLIGDTVTLISATKLQHSGRSVGLVSLTANAADALVTSAASEIAGGTVSLSAGSLQTAGLITADDALTLTSLSGDINNSAGLSGKTVTLSSAADVIHDGILSSETVAHITAAGNVTTGAASGITAADIYVTGEAVSNAGVIVSSAASTLTARSGSVQNTGTVSAGTSLTLNSATALGNSGLLLAASLDLTTTDALSFGVTSRIVANDLSITAASLSNAGLLDGKSDLDLTTTSGAFTNSGGIIGSDVVLTSAAAFTNSGQVQSTGALGIAATGALTSSTGAEIIGQVVTLTGTDITNAGLINGVNATLTGTGAVSNSGTTFVSGLAHLTGASVQVNGTLRAHDMRLDGAQISTGASSVLEAERDMLIIASSNLSHSGRATALGTLDARVSAGAAVINGTLHGDVTKLNASGTLTLGSSARLIGQSSIEVSANALAGGLDSTDFAKFLTNGNLALAFTNGGLSVGTGQQIAHSGNLALSLGGDITNQGTIKSSGHLELWSGGIITNAAGGVLKSGGNMLLTATSLVNESALPPITTTSSTAVTNEGDPDVTPINGHTALWHTITTTTTTESIASNPVASKILAGGNLVVLANQITNKNGEVVAGGNVTAAPSVFTNIPVEVNETKLIATNTRHTYGYCVKNFFGGCKKKYTTWYTDASETIVTPIASFDASVTAGGNINISAGSVVGSLNYAAGANTSTLLGSSYVAPTAMPSLTLGGLTPSTVPLSSVLVGSLSGLVATKASKDIIVAPGASKSHSAQNTGATGVTLPSAQSTLSAGTFNGTLTGAAPGATQSMFAGGAGTTIVLPVIARPGSFNTDSVNELIDQGATRLGSGRSALMTQEQFLTSNYMMDVDRLQYRDELLFNLQDGLPFVPGRFGAVEETLLQQSYQDAIASEPGANFRAPDPALFGLANFGLTQDGTLTLAALTNERGAGDLSITAGSIFARGGTASASGAVTIIADQSLSFTSVNIKGASVALKAAEGDLTLAGSQISATDSLKLEAGGSLDILALSEKFKGYSGEQGNRTHRIGNKVTGSSITAGGDFSAIAGKDLKITASKIDAKGSLLLEATNDIELAFLTETDNQDTLGLNSGVNSHSKRTDSVVTQLTSGTGLTIKAGRDATLAGATVTAGTTLDISATRDVVIETAFSSRDSGWSGKKSGERSGNQLSVVTELKSGTAMTIAAGNDATLTGTKLDAGTTVSLKAENDITLLASVNAEFESSNSKSGNFLRKTEKRDSRTATTYQGVSITSGGDTTVRAKNNLTTAGTTLKAGGSATLEATTGKLLAGTYEDKVETHTYRNKSILGGLLGGTSTTHIIDTTATATDALAALDLTTVSGGDTELVGTKLEAGGKLTVKSGGDLIVKAAVSNHFKDHDETNNGLIVTKTIKEDINRDTASYAKFLAGGDLSFEVGGETRVTLYSPTDEARPDATSLLPAELLALDGLRLLDGDLADEYFFEETQKLSPAFKALVTIIVTQGVGAIGGGAGLSGVLGVTSPNLSWLATAVDKFAATFIVESLDAAVAGEFDLGEILGTAAFAGVSAGVTSGINLDTFGIDLGTGAQNSILNFGTGFGIDTGLTWQNLAERTLDNVLRSSLSTGVYGTDFGESFKAGFKADIVSLATADFQDWVGDQNLGEGSFGHAALHGFVGCASSMLSGGNCASGAVGGVAQSIYAGTLDGKSISDRQQQQTAALIGGSAALFFSGGEAQNVSIGSSIARSGMANNRQMHRSEAELIRNNAAEFARQMGLCSATGPCSEKEIAQAEALLSRQAALQIDRNLGAGIRENAQARAFLQSISPTGVISGTEGTQYIDQSQSFFSVTNEQFDNQLINFGHLSDNRDLYQALPILNSTSSGFDAFIVSTGISGSGDDFNDLSPDQIFEVVRQVEGAFDRRLAGTDPMTSFVLANNIGGLVDGVRNNALSVLNGYDPTTFTPAQLELYTALDYDVKNAAAGGAIGSRGAVGSRPSGELPRKNFLPNAPNTGADGFYDPRAWRQNYEDFYNGNVTSTTVPPFSAKNVHLAGSRHPETGVVFDQRGYPIFDDVASYDTRFSGSQFSGVDYQGQMRMATRDLRNTLDSNPQLRSQFEADQLQAIQSGKASIPRLTWHHHQDTGRMQLVPRDIHRDTGHIGGNAVSGGQ